MAQDTESSVTEATTETLTWEPESPFISDVPLSRNAATVAATSAGRAFASAFEAESPFIPEYAGEEGAPGPQAELFASLVGEFYDNEFEEALEDLINEAAGVAEEQSGFELEDPGQQRLEMEHTVQNYLQPLERAAETMLDRLADGIGERDLSPLSEAELEAHLEQFATSETGLSPTFENFLGGLWRKAKQAVRGALSIAQRAAGVVGKFLPHRWILNKLKGLVRPLLQRVLRFAINKLPVGLRPVARQLAQRFLGVSPTFESEETEDRTEAASPDSAEIQHELDAHLAGYLVGGEGFETEAAVQQFLAEQEAPTGDPIRELDRSRGEFARQVVRLQDGENLQPVVENFIPAILAALRLGIRIIGRPRVVNFLAGYVAKLISKYIGQQQATALSRSLVDAGLRLVSLEATEGPAPLAAGYALASTVEDTVNRLVQTAPESAWESETLLEGYIREAFEQAASAHFPDPLIRGELHEASQTSGIWVALPDGTARKRYKKYSRILETTISPQTAATVKTFGGIALRHFVKDRLGIPTDKPIRARVHIYEAIPGTWLSTIALHEKKVLGLGSARREAWSLIHPLTPEVAGLLLNEPGLGRPVDPLFLARRGRIAVGQRFYYLEIPGARVRLAPRWPSKFPRPARSSQMRVVFDFPKRQLRVFLYHSEADAQNLAKYLRKRLPISVVIQALKAKFDVGLSQILSGGPTNAIRIIHEAELTEQFAGPLTGNVLRLSGRYLAGMLTRWLLEVFKREVESRYDRFTGEFEQAAKADADGLTLVIIFQAGPVLEKLRRLFKPEGLVSLLGIVRSLVRHKVGEYWLNIRPGFAYW